MNSEEIKEKVKDVMSLVLETDKSQIQEDSSTDSIENWDSLRQLNLIIALEEAFNVSIPDEEVGNMVNYKIVCHIISDCLSDGKY